MVKKTRGQEENIDADGKELNGFIKLRKLIEERAGRQRALPCLFCWPWGQVGATLEWGTKSGLN